MNTPFPTHSEILFRYLGSRARRFCEAVHAENESYSLNPLKHGRPGFIHRDTVRFRLERMAYTRFHRQAA